jgi:hypothetical protein
MRRAGRGSLAAPLGPDGNAGDFLAPAAVTQLCELVPFPRAFVGTGYVDIDHAGRFKAPYTHPGRRFAIRPEEKLEISTGPLITLADTDKIQGSVSLPFCPRGQAQVPVFAQQAVVLVSLVVPVGYVYWIDGYAFDLFPSTANELNYFWQLRVNGQDILNRGTSGLALGRPIHAPQKVQVGYDKGTMLRAQEGALVELVCQAISTIGASDSISGTIFGTLEGA